MTGQMYDNNHNLGKCPDKKQKQKQGLKAGASTALKMKMVLYNYSKNSWNHEKYWHFCHLWLSPEEQMHFVPFSKIYGTNCLHSSVDFHMSEHFSCIEVTVAIIFYGENNSGKTQTSMVMTSSFLVDKFLWVLQASLQQQKSILIVLFFLWIRIF